VQKGVNVLRLHTLNLGNAVHSVAQKELAHGPLARIDVACALVKVTRRDQDALLGTGDTLPLVDADSVTNQLKEILVVAEDDDRGR
jgi:hypothetical protein